MYMENVLIGLVLLVFFVAVTFIAYEISRIVISACIALYAKIVYHEDFATAFYIAYGGFC